MNILATALLASLASSSVSFADTVHAEDAPQQKRFIVKESIFAESKIDWKKEIKVDPTPANEKKVVISVSETPLLHSPDWKRRDPSDIIKVGDTYYIWYAKIHEDMPGFPGGWRANTWYATSKDSFEWEEQGIAIDYGEAGSWDDSGAYTPNILVYKDKYYLAYTGLGGPFDLANNQAAIGMVVSDSPDGPWTRFDNNPVVAPTDSYEVPDAFLCDDTVFVVRDDKIWLYYKGYAKAPGEDGRDLRVRGTMLLASVADQPEGPYIKQNVILHTGHEAVLWKNPDGSVGSFCTSDGPPRYYESTDGVTFKSMNPIVPQKAMGLYRADLAEGYPGEKPTWGICAEVNSAGLGLRRIEIKWPEE